MPFQKKKNLFKWKESLFFLTLWSLQVAGFGNNLGIPFLQHYTKEDFQADVQNWIITQDEDGILYVGNDDGLLTYDGRDWTLFPLPNRTVVRSVVVDSRGRVYVGGQDEVGYFQRDDRGRFQYHSLKPLIPAPYQGFADVFDIVSVEQGIFFRASDRIYHYADEQIEVLDPGGPILYLGAVGNQVFIQIGSGQLLRLKVNPLQPEAVGGSALAGTMIMASIGLSPDSLLFASFRNGLFLLRGTTITPYPTQHDDWLKEKRIQCATLIGQDNIAIGSVLDGMLIIDRTGRATALISKEQGLQNPNVHSIFPDREQNLWLGLDYGIDYVLINTPFRRLRPDGDLEGTSYAAILYNDRLYCGTPNGLFAAPWEEYYDPFSNNYEMVAGSGGQVWGLNVINDQLLMGHDEGAFLVEGMRAQRISPAVGHWSFVPMQGKPDLMLSGTYFGLELFRQSDDRWQYVKKLEGLEESCRIMTEAPSGAIWISHPYRGIYQVELNDTLGISQVKLYDERNGLPSNLNNYLARIGGDIIVCGNTGTFRYDAVVDTFLFYPKLSRFFGPDEQVKRLVEDKKGNIWFVTDQQAGVLEVEETSTSRNFRKRIIPELVNRMVSRFEFIFPLDEENVFFGAEKGLIRFNPSASAWKKPASVLTPRIKAIFLADSLIGRAYVPLDALASFSNENNSFRFQFTAPHFNKMQQVEYRAMLEGWEEEWSEWSYKTEREYSKLTAGEYTFKVQARDAWGQVSPVEATYTFSIAPPWYLSPLAYVFYSLLALGFLLSMILVPRRRFQREKQELLSEQERQKEKHLQVVQQSEATIVRLKNEKLTAEINHKNKELASVTMHLVQKNELLNKLGQDLKKISKESKESGTKKAIQQLMILLKHDDHLDEDWEQFFLHFDQVHSGFIKRLREEYPQLTPKDHKLCAYLRMNLTSKEIAPLLNISVRGVEISRYRLRKKLDLDSSVNLNEFMMNF